MYVVRIISNPELFVGHQGRSFPAERILRQHRICVRASLCFEMLRGELQVEKCQDHGHVTKYLEGQGGFASR